VYLVFNARKAVEATTGSDKIIQLSVRQDKFISFEMKDNGPGMPKSDLDRIRNHEFGFTTSTDPGRGPGLGMAIIRRVVWQHKGKFEIDSKENEGTTTRLEISLISQDNRDEHQTKNPHRR
jgi:signal transduction histidine kinase